MPAADRDRDDRMVDPRTIDFALGLLAPEAVQLLFGPSPGLVGQAADRLADHLRTTLG